MRMMLHNPLRYWRIDWIVNKLNEDRDAALEARKRQVMRVKNHKARVDAARAARRAAEAAQRSSSADQSSTPTK